MKGRDSIKAIFHKKTNQLKIVLVTLFVVCVLIFAFSWFNNRLHSIISATNNTFLKETSGHQATIFNTKLTDQMTILESFATQFSTVDFNNYTEFKNTALSLKGAGEFKQLTVANSSGACISNDGKYSNNISKKHYFQAALSGTPTVSNGMDVGADGEHFLALSVPIYQGDKIVGVLTGIYDRSILDSLFSTTIFNGKGYTYVVDSSGNIIVKSENVNSIIKEDNYLEFLKKVEFISDTKYDDISADFAQGVTNTIHYKLGSQERYASYYPVGVHDWYVITTMTEDIIATQMQNLSFIVVVLIAILTVILVAVFFFIIWTMRNAELVMQKNERFTLINAQNQSVIFDFDINKKILDLSGDTGFIMGKDYPTKGPLDKKYLSSRIHPDDALTFEKFLQSINSTETHNSFEFRFKCDDDKYYWMRLSSTLVRENDVPVKMVGNIVNVESQKSQELNLKHAAEHDPMTGLLNKKAMQESVEEFLKKEDKNTMHALFIIDLDNFKQVNDNLGHIYGDKVLIDVSSKLFRIFSEKDFIGRIGGDEFNAFLDLSAIDDPAYARELIIQKGKALNKALLETYRGENDISVTVSSSIGIAIYSKDGATYQTLYANADKALYVSKNNGKNRFTFYDKNTM